MPKPAKFKYQLGQSVKFKFYDGSVHSGKIERTSYRNEDVDYLDTQYNQCMYTCHVPDRSGNYSRGYMIYTVTETMIKTVLDNPITIKALKDQPKVKVLPIDAMGISNEEVEVMSESLDDAINKQKRFLNR